MYEGIQPIENREFISSIGNWAGDITWDPGPIGGRTGLIKYTKPAGITYVEARLAYPYVKPRRGKPNTYSLYFYYPLGQSAGGYTYLTITDGIYTYNKPPFIQAIMNQWVALGHSIDIPTDWTVENTQIKFKLSGSPGAAYIYYADQATLYTIGRKHHLTVMGAD